MPRSSSTVPNIISLPFPGALFLERDKGRYLFVSGHSGPRRLARYDGRNGVVYVRGSACKFIDVFLRSSESAPMKNCGPFLGTSVPQRYDRQGYVAYREAFRVIQEIAPGEPTSIEGAESLLNGMFFDPKRYDLARVGIYKINQKLSLATRIKGHKASRNVVSDDGELILSADTVISPEKATEIENAGINEVFIYPITTIGDTVRVSDAEFKVIGNARVDADVFIRASFSAKELKDFDIKATPINEKVRTGVLRSIISELRATEKGHLTDALTEALKAHQYDLMPKHLTVEDIIATVSYFLGLEYGIGHLDNIDHLGNRRVRSVGELLQNQIRIGFSRMERNIRERMGAVPDISTVTPLQLVNTRPVSAAVKEFFGSSQLSQFMDQPNPLAELTHKRRLSALGLGLSALELEVRDVTLFMAECTDRDAGSPTSDDQFFGDMRLSISTVSLKHPTGVMTRRRGSSPGK